MLEGFGTKVRCHVETYFHRNNQQSYYFKSENIIRLIRNKTNCRNTVSMYKMKN